MIEFYRLTLTRDQLLDVIFAVESRISSIKVCLFFLPSAEGNADNNFVVSAKRTDLEKYLSDANCLLVYLKKFL